MKLGLSKDLTKKLPGGIVKRIMKQEGKLFITK